MTKGEKFDAAWLTVIGIALVLGFTFGVRRERATVTVPMARPSPTTAPPDATPCPTPRPPVIGRAVGRRSVACIGDGARMLCPPPETNFDALPAECARKFLALVAREGAEDGPSPRDWSRYRAEGFEAAARACPQEFKR